LSSDPDKKCNSNLDSAANIVLQIFIGLLFTVTVLIIISSSTQKTAEGSVGGHIIESEENLEEKEDFTRVKDNGKVKDDEDDEHVFSITNATITF